MKYIMYQVTKPMKRKIPIVFPNALTHSDMHEAVKDKIPELKGAKLVSAGEYSPLNGIATGQSSTLKLKAKADDSRIITMNDYEHGLY